MTAPPWIFEGARIEHAALADAGRAYVTRVLSVTAAGATILDERNGSTAVVSIANLRRNYRPAPPAGLRERAATWWRSTQGRREAIAWALRHPVLVMELVERDARGRRVRRAVSEAIEARRVN